jgi:hypothetical protein
MSMAHSVATSFQLVALSIESEKFDPGELTET